MESDKDQELKIDGIKLSSELVAVRLRVHPPNYISVAEFCHLLAEEKINMPFLSIDTSRLGCLITCCVDKEDSEKTKELMTSKYDGFKKGFQFIPQVGLLSIFPHQYSLRLLVIVLSVFAKAGIPVFAAASSLSVLTFVTRYRSLDDLVDLFGRHLHLPPDHVPLRQEIRVRQTDILRKED